MRARALFCLAALLPASQAIAADEEQPAVAIVDVRPGPGATAAQAAKARAALAGGLAQFRVRVIEDHPAIVAAHGPGADTATGAGLAQARGLARDGKKLFDDLDPQGAEVKFRAAADLFEKNIAGLSNPADLIGTYLYLARVFFATEREVLARDIFRRVVQLQPDLVLDKAVYPPGMISVFDDVKKSLLASPLGSMSVSSTPSPAQIFLDGRDRGLTPADLVNLPSGVHTLTLRRPGYAPFVRPVDVTTFRVEKVAADLTLDRHPSLDALFGPKGLEKDALGLTVGDYVEAVASAASVDVVFVGRLLKENGDFALEIRPYRHDGKTWGEPRRFPIVGTPPKVLDKVASELLSDAAGAGWIAPIAARRNVSAGGGAIDETAKLLLRLSFAPGARLGSPRQNFPSAPTEGLRIAADYRLGSRLLLTGETGFDFLSESNIVLTGSGGSIVASHGAHVQGVDLSIPLDLGGRYYFGISTLAPFASAGIGIRYDQLSFRESLKYDSISGSSGIGFDGFLGGGLDYALSPKTGIFVEGRLHAGTVGVGDVKVHTRASPPIPDRTLHVDPGLDTGIRLYLGYLKVF
jgi:hypothetical protein